jgi:prepilin-type N-terminal cleavage/methylation domain-containing protein
MRRLRSHYRRVGFTLIELLVVIAIIAALMALTASAVIKFMAVQQTNNTQSTLNKVQSVLNRQWAAAKDQAWKETIPATVQTFIQANLAGTDANVAGRTRVIYVKLRMRQLFPMNFDEAINPAPLPAIPGYVTYLSQLGVTGSTGANYESAACLLMALTRAQSGGGADSADLAGGGASTSFTLPSGNSIRALADAWQQPLYFTRVPAGYTPLNPIPYPTGSPGINDPGDPQGYLNAGGWPKTANTSLFTLLTLQPLAAQNCSYKLVPMVASGGPNRKLEVDATWFSGSPIDDLFSNP